MHHKHYMKNRISFTVDVEICQQISISIYYLLCYPIMTVCNEYVDKCALFFVEFIKFVTSF